MAELLINNPYDGVGTCWSKGEIHAHVCRARGSNDDYDNGVSANKIYKHAADAGLEFVCMSVEVLHELGGADRFGDVGSGREHGVTGVAAREIQNNYYPCYFHERTSRYLHVLTIGECDGFSICAHPKYYELGRPEPGGDWSEIRQALLHPDAGGPLETLRVCGLEVYNGFTLARVKRQDRKQDYRDYEEACWDDMLTRGRRYWGFAGNDSYYSKAYRFDRFDHLGLVYAAVPADASAADIVRALREGRFYSSSGVELARTPLTISVDRETITAKVAATEQVNWTMYVHERIGNVWRLRSEAAASSETAEFKVSGTWSYFRIRCEDVKKGWRRAWLQPVTNDAHFGRTTFERDDRSDRALA